MPDDTSPTRDPDHEGRTLRAVRKAALSVPFYAKQDLGQLVAADALAEVLPRLPLLTRDKVRPTLPKAWFPEGRDARAELASGTVSVIEAGSATSRVRVLFDPRWWRMQERRALAIHPRAARVLEGEVGAFRDSVLWVPERGTGSCGSGDPSYEERLEGSRLHLNSRQDPTFWTEPVMTRMLDEIAVHQTSALLADPFYLDVLARHAAILNRRLDVRGFVATMRARATLAHRQALGRVYPGTVIDVLGSREVGTLFVEGADGLLHHAPFATHVELLRAKVETPGAADVALVVVTTVEREVQPLVRYVLGDLVQIAPGTSGGPFSSVPSLRTIEGTIDDAILRPDGAIVTAGALDRAIGPRPRAYQISQNEAGAVEVEVASGSAREVEDAIAPLLQGMKITVRATTSIGADPNGKYRTTRRRVPLSLSAAFEACEGV
jgi:phenylacetate-coenzyme A ligase PaaK-like adenylate-forming protein